MNCPEIERIDKVQGIPPRTKRLKPEKAGEPYPNQSGRHLRPELEKEGGKKRLPFQQMHRRRPSCTQILDLLSQRERLRLRVGQWSEELKEVQLKRPQEKPAIRNQIRRTG